MPDSISKSTSFRRGDRITDKESSDGLRSLRPTSVSSEGEGSSSSRDPLHQATQLKKRTVAKEEKPKSDEQSPGHASIKYPPQTLGNALLPFYHQTSQAATKPRPPQPSAISDSPQALSSESSRRKRNIKKKNPNAPLPTFSTTNSGFVAKVLAAGAKGSADLPAYIVAVLNKSQSAYGASRNYCVLALSLGASLVVSGLQIATAAVQKKSAETGSQEESGNVSLAGGSFSLLPLAAGAAFKLWEDSGSAPWFYRSSKENLNEKLKQNLSFIHLAISDEEKKRFKQMDVIGALLSLSKDDEVSLRNFLEKLDPKII